MPTTSLDYREIANTIKSQIHTWTHMACGSRHFTYDSKNPNGNLSFQVGNGRGRIKGILIELMPSDTYRVTYQERFVKGTRKYQMALTQTVDDVYCESLDAVVYRLVNIQANSD